MNDRVDAYPYLQVIRPLAKVAEGFTITHTFTTG